MRWRTVLSVLLLMGLVAAACADDSGTTTTAAASQATAATQAPATTQAPVTTQAPAATAVPTTSAPATTQAPGPPGPPVGLFADGIGTTSFGDDADTALAALIAELGQPEIDDGWTDAALSFCGGTMVRFPQWDGVFVILTDAATAYADAGTPHLAFWAAWDGSLYSTSDEVVPGITTLGEVVDRFGAVDTVFDDALGIWTFVAPVGTRDAGIEFEVGDPDDLDAPIVGVSAGQANICGE